MSARILVVEDEEALTTLLRYNLDAEGYDVEPDDNRFYLFNPFSVQIFQKVISNILLSVEQHPRSIDVILYYPTPEYIQFLEGNTAFELLKEVRVPELYDQNNNERFVIFRLEETK